MNILAIKKIEKNIDYTVTLTFSMYGTDAKTVNRVKDKLYNQLIRNSVDEITVQTDETVHYANIGSSVPASAVDDEDENEEK